MMTLAHLQPTCLRVAPKRLAWVLWFFWASLNAQPQVRHADVEREIKQGRFDQVLVLAEQALGLTPRDPQMRFWRAWALERAGRVGEALDAYVALSQDHPELPEPHNNAGVLLMRLGRIDEAQAAFQMALRMNAGYTEAMENLGDVLQWQARRWYEKSLQTNPAQPALKQKIKALPPLPSLP